MRNTARNARTWLLIPWLLWAAGSEPGQAQEISPAVAPAPFNPDTPQTPSVLLREESRTKTARYESTKSPALAVLLSAIAPGTGQLYNESYWKAPIVWALGGYWAYEWAQQNNKYRDFRDQYNQSVEAAPPFGNLQLQRVRDFYRDERDKFAWYLGALYFLNLLDAYVGANLYDFNVTPDLGAEGVALPRGTLTLRYTF